VRDAASIPEFPAIVFKDLALLEISALFLVLEAPLAHKPIGMRSGLCASPSEGLGGSSRRIRSIADPVPSKCSAQVIS